MAVSTDCVRAAAKRTDALTAKDQVGVVQIPEDLNVIAEYPIAAVADAAHPNLANAWLKLVLSDVGRAALQRAGFTLPSSASPTP